MTPLIQIVPALPPAVNGVGDYAALLAQALDRYHGIPTRFVVERPASSVPIPGVTHLSEHSSIALLAALQSSSSAAEPVLLHYVGYGYDPRGCPSWLVDGLESWKGSNPKRRLIIMFHEVYASGPPWRRSFWTSPLQRRLAGRLAGMADLCRTNIRLHAARLKKLSPRPGLRIEVQAVFSNFGEPSTLTPIAKRPPNLMAYRLPQNPSPLYRRTLLAACQAVGAGTILSFGGPVESTNRLPIPVRRLGIISAGEVASHLATCRGGFLDYFHGCLGKSGIFAAFAAHRITPFLPRPNGAEQDGLGAGIEYVVPHAGNPAGNLAGMQVVADRAWEWYAPHSVRRTADSIALEITSPTPSCT